MRRGFVHSKRDKLRSFVSRHLIAVIPPTGYAKPLSLPPANLRAERESYSSKVYAENPIFGVTMNTDC